MSMEPSRWDLCPYKKRQESLPPLSTLHHVRRIKKKIPSSCLKGILKAQLIFSKISRLLEVGVRHF